MDLRPTASGRMMSIEECLKNPTVWKCCNVRANAIATLPRYVYKRLRPKGKEVNKRDPRNRMINLFASSRVTAVEFERDMMFQMLIYGNAFALIERDEKFKPIKWYCLRSKNMEVAYSEVLQDYVYRYRVPGKNEKVELRSWQVHHRRGPSLDQVLGLSVFELALNSFTLGISMQEYMARLIENDATPRGLLFTEAVLSDDTKDKIRKKWMEKYGGPAKAGEIGILDAKMQFKQVGSNNDVLEFVDTFKNQKETVADWFMVPYPMAGIMEGFANNTMEQQNRDFMQNCLGPDLRQNEQTMMRDLLFEDELDDYFIEHVVEARMKGDFPEQTSYMVAEIMAGVKNINEVRDWKNMNPVEGGDVNFFPMNYAPLTEVEALALAKLVTQQVTQENPPGTDLQPQVTDKKKDVTNQPKNPVKRSVELAAFKPIVEDACRRIVGREVVALEREIKRAKTSKEIFDFVETFSSEQIEYSEKILLPIMITIGDVSGDILRSDQKRIISSVTSHFAAATKETLIEKPALAQMSESVQDWAANRASEMSEQIITLLEQVNQ